jgi:hypothetical protein
VLFVCSRLLLHHVHIITTKLKDLHAGLEAQEAMERVGFVESRGQRYWRGGYSIVSMEGDVVFR